VSEWGCLVDLEATLIYVNCLTFKRILETQVKLGPKSSCNETYAVLIKNSISWEHNAALLEFSPLNLCEEITACCNLLPCGNWDFLHL
jgi:hypothetical protein